MPWPLAFLFFPLRTQSCSRKLIGLELLNLFISTSVSETGRGLSSGVPLIFFLFRCNTLHQVCSKYYIIKLQLCHYLKVLSLAFLRTIFLFLQSPLVLPIEWRGSSATFYGAANETGLIITC